MPVVALSDPPRYVCYIIVLSFLALYVAFRPILFEILLLFCSFKYPFKRIHSRIAGFLDSIGYML
jgi:hypothetical protein